MLSISLLANKPVLCLFECECVGEICDLWFDSKLKKVLGFLVSTDCKIADEMLLLPFKNVANFGEDVITVKNKSMLKNQTDFPQIYLKNNPIGAEVFYADGKRISYLKDLSFDKQGEIYNLILENGQTIVQSKIIKFSTSTILVNPFEEPFKLSPPKKITFPKLKDNVTVEILDEEFLIEENYFKNFEISNIDQIVNDDIDIPLENLNKIDELNELEHVNDLKIDENHDRELSIKGQNFDKKNHKTDDLEQEIISENNFEDIEKENFMINLKTIDHSQKENNFGLEQEQCYINSENESIQKNCRCILNRKTKFDVRLNGFTIEKGTVVDIPLIKKAQKVGGLKMLIVSVLTNIDAQLY